jgi:hypothetical protein
MRTSIPSRRADRLLDGRQDLFKEPSARCSSTTSPRAGQHAALPLHCLKHDSQIGNARADQLFARVKIELKPELAQQKRPPRSFGDYVIHIDDSDLPAGVSIEHWV